jgi:hypothetical protein
MEPDLYDLKFAICKQAIYYYKLLKNSAIDKKDSYHDYLQWEGDLFDRLAGLCRTNHELRLLVEDFRAKKSFYFDPFDNFSFQKTKKEVCDYLQLMHFEPNEDDPDLVNRVTLIKREKDLFIRLLMSCLNKSKILQLFVVVDMIELQDSEILDGLNNKIIYSCEHENDIILI